VTTMERKRIDTEAQGLAGSSSPRARCRRGPAIGAAALSAVFLFAAAVSAQTLDGEIVIAADGLRLERPSSLAVSPSGEQIAVADPQANRIAVIDYFGRPLWSAGGAVDLGRPLAVAFTGENELVFTRTADLRILRLIRDNPAELDSIADLAPVLEPHRRLDQLLRTPERGWLALDRKTGEVLRFDESWGYQGIAVPHGSGKGKVLVPSALVPLADGRFVVTDEKNYPAQLFSAEGKFLLYFGWSSPGEERGWEAAGGTADSRSLIWVADRTAAAFRIFDPAGGAVAAVPFPQPLFRPAAMTTTIDNRVLVLDEFGRALFYRVQ